MEKLYVDEERCEGCGLCLKQCGITKNISIRNGIAQFGENSDNCIECLHCFKVCPNDAILYEEAEENGVCIYNKGDLVSPVIKRRSCREYLEKDINRETIIRIINEANTAPRFDINFTEREFIVIDDKEKLQAVRTSVMEQMEKIKNFFKIMIKNPFLSLAKRKEFKMIIELFELKIEMNKTKDILFYDAPVLFLVVGDKSKTGSPDNSFYAMGQFLILAEENGFATCINGFVAFFSKTVSKCLGLSNNYKIYAAAVIGHPGNTFYRSIVRNDSSITWN